MIINLILSVLFKFGSFPRAIRVKEKVFIASMREYVPVEDLLERGRKAGLDIPPEEI
jgi:hypothetical protein